MIFTSYRNANKEISVYFHLSVYISDRIGEKNCYWKTAKSCAFTDYMFCTLSRSFLETPSKTWIGSMYRKTITESSSMKCRWTLMITLPFPAASSQTLRSTDKFCHQKPETFSMKRITNVLRSKWKKKEYKFCSLGTNL